MTWIQVVIGVLAIPGLYLSATPIIYAVIWALCGTETPGVLRPPSTRWLVHVLTDGEWLAAIGISTAFAVAASTASMFLVSVSNYFLRIESRVRDYGTTLVVLLPLLFPQVIFALAWSLILAKTEIPAVIGVGVAHMVTMLPVQYLVVKSESGVLRQSQLWAGLVMGARPLANMRRVYLPLMRRPLVTAWIIGALISFDELVVTLFLWSDPSQPVALRLWNLFGRHNDPTPAVVALTILGVVGLLALSITLGFRTSGWRRR